MSNGISKTSKGENMKKYIIILLSCFITTAYADNWVCGYNIIITANYTNDEDASYSEDKNIDSAGRGANGFAAFVNNNVKFFTTFIQNGGVRHVWPGGNIQRCGGVSNSYVANCNGATNVPPSYWNDCPNYSNSNNGFVCEKCPSLDDVAGTNGENMITVAAVLNGGIGCLNYENADIKKLVDGTVDQLSSDMCGSMGGQAPKYVTYDSANKQLDSTTFPNMRNGCSYNSITITKNTVNKFNTIDECYIPKDNELHDDSGTYVFTENCHWKR